MLDRAPECTAPALSERLRESPIRQGRAGPHAVITHPASAGCVFPASDICFWLKAIVDVAAALLLDLAGGEHAVGE